MAKMKRFSLENESRGLETSPSSRFGPDQDILPPPAYLLCGQDLGCLPPWSLPAFPNLSYNGLINRVGPFSGSPWRKPRCRFVLQSSVGKGRPQHPVKPFNGFPLVAAHSYNRLGLLEPRLGRIPALQESKVGQT
jgi:hypothetical protein